jgi:hypothetical protein
MSTSELLGPDPEHNFVPFLEAIARIYAGADLHVPAMPVCVCVGGWVGGWVGVHYTYIYIHTYHQSNVRPLIHTYHQSTM